MSNNANRTALTASAIVLFMIALTFASVPLYDLICRVTGIAGTTQQADAAPGAVENAPTFTVRFNADTDEALPWNFKPVQNRVDVTLGEMTLVNYTATNISDKPVTGTATFNVTPLKVGKYFAKIECFCFQEQTLEPGESMEFPVSFYVDPRIMDDSVTKEVRTITLSYTFYNIDEES